VNYFAELDNLERTFRRRFGDPIGKGRHRVVFRSKNGKYVYKIPRNEDGETANAIEWHAYRKAQKQFPVAKCRVLAVNDFPVICMEYIEPVTRGCKLPEWVDWVDCSQVGYNRKGHLVVYDGGA
jgi:hypothetical protein